MKKTILKILCCVLAMVLTLSVAACGAGGNGENADGRRILKWEVLKAGYGTIPYEKIAEAFMAEHPDVLVKIVFNPSIATTTASRLESNTNLADVYSYRSIDSIKRWAIEGWVEPLDDVYNAQLSTGKTVAESLTGNTQEVCSYNGTPYAIPEYTSLGGIVYNKSLFQQYGWETPKTTAELEALCKQILKDTNNAVAPIVYCGGAADGYLYIAVDNWVYSYEGMDQLDNFFSYESPEVFNPTAYKGKMYALQNLQKFFYDEGAYTMTGSVGMTHIVAQTKLIQGQAAMMVNGSWFENEMSDVLQKNPDVEMGMIPLPEMSDPSGKVLHSANYTTVDEKQVIQAEFGSNYFIPANAANKEDAKEFLRFLSEPEICAMYTRYTNAVRPFEYDLSPDAEAYAGMSSFGKSVLTMAAESYLYTPNVTSPIAIKGLTGFWARGSTPFVAIRDSVESINQALQNDYDYAQSNWDRWNELVD